MLNYVGWMCGYFKVYIDYKLTDISKFSELFNYLKQHETVCDEFEDYYIYYKAVMYK